MSLDCYPLGLRKTINLTEQPIALDVAYNDNLFITVINQCQTIVIYDLSHLDSKLSSTLDAGHHDTSSSSSSSTSNNGRNNAVIREFSLGHNIVIDQIIYNNKGDYLACVGHKNGQLSVYTIFNWRQVEGKNNESLNSASELDIFELDIASVHNDDDIPIDYRRKKLNSIDCCQRTGNLALSCGDVVLIYKYLSGSKCYQYDNNNEKEDEQQLEDEDDDNEEKEQKDDDHNEDQEEEEEEEEEDDADSLHSKADTVKEFNNQNDTSNKNEKRKKKYFSHIISIKLTITAIKICLLENYLSITSIDHVQVLKLELLTLQIQSDLFDNGNTELQQQQHLQTLQQQQTHKSGNKLERTINFNNNGSRVGDIGNIKRFGINKDEIRSDTTSTTSTTLATTTTCSSLISDSNSTTTNFSSFTNPTSGVDNNNTINNSDISIITMNNQHQQQQQLELDLDANNDSNHSADDCITWNLNTKKLVKLPTLMHNTSKNLSSYHIYHPLELLGPASESIACRVSAFIYSEDFCQNQLEAVVMLCKQFDFEKDPIKSTHLQPVYLSSNEDLKRLNKSALYTLDSQQQQPNDNNNIIIDTSQQHEVGLLKSNDYDLLVSVTCFVSTLTSCFLYSLHGKKVVRTQTITHPDMCLDLRPDLLNVYLLSPLGLQICSTGLCDSIFRYDWSSSADLNLSFIAKSRTRILTTAKYLILIEASSSSSTSASNNNQKDNNQCIVEYMEKPDLISLYDRILHTVNRCNSISIRSNMLTYLHATAQLTLLSNNNPYPVSSRENVNIMKTVTIMLAKQLLQKKQTNVITNNKIDKAIKHLLDISMCDLSELMKRHWQALTLKQENEFYIRSSEIESDFESSSNNNPDHHSSFDNKFSLANKDVDHHSSIVFNCTNYGITLGDDDEPLDTDYELIKIYLKYAKYSPSLMDYLIENSENQNISSRIIDYMFEHNPRLLIKCAQRYPINVHHLPQQVEQKNDNGNGEERQDIVLLVLVERLKQLAELDSTGINRATVLFTLAILYNALDEKQKCLLTLDQIKPSNHLAITMCSNYEHSHSIARLVIENYPDVYRLFLAQLTKKDKFAAQEYIARHGTITTSSFSNINSNNNNNNNNNGCDDNNLKKIKRKKIRTISGDKKKSSNKKSQIQRLHPDGTVLDQFEDGNDCFSSGGDNNSNSNLSSSDEQQSDISEEDEQELFERKLKLFNEIPTVELIDLLLKKKQTSPNKESRVVNNDNSSNNDDADIDYETCRSFIEASINLLESQFILARLRENSSRDN